jgi:hypothetical protein
MAMKKQNPAVAKRIADRKAFVKDKVASKGITAKQARQRYFVQTRMAEMKAAGKTVTPEMRKQLQQKFQSGDVSRKGFAAPKKKTGKTGVTKSASGYSYTNQSGKVDKRILTPDTKNKPAYSRAQIIRNSDKAIKSGSTGYTRADSSNSKSQYGPFNPKPSVSGFPKGSSKSKPKDTRSAGQRIGEAAKKNKVVSPNTRKPAKPSSSPKMRLY